jgi:phage terminase large subunit-like protein
MRLQAGLCRLTSECKNVTVLDDTVFDDFFRSLRLHNRVFEDVGAYKRLFLSYSLGYPAIVPFLNTVQCRRSLLFSDCVSTMCCRAGSVKTGRRGVVPTLASIHPPQLPLDSRCNRTLLNCTRAIIQYSITPTQSLRSVLYITNDSSISSSIKHTRTRGLMVMTLTPKRSTAVRFKGPTPQERDGSAVRCWHGCCERL